MSRKPRRPVPSAVADPRRPTGAVLAAVEAIPGDVGWHKHASLWEFQGAAATLADLGMPDREIIVLLTDLYQAVVEQFGG